MYLGMLILGWLGGFVMGVIACAGFGVPIWAGFLIWSFGGSALVLAGSVAGYLRHSPNTRTGRTVVRVG